MPSICITSLCPYERYNLLLCELDGTMFIVDCGWDLNPPSLSDGSTKTPTHPHTYTDPKSSLDTVNWARVDFILISNYEQMALLPYITEYTEFSGPVYATEPTKSYGKCVLEEGLLSCTQSSASSSSRSMLYSERDIGAAFERITDVRFNEVAAPVPLVQVYARSSGYCVGGGNWTVKYKGHRTVFVGTSSVVAGGSLHAQEWDPTAVGEAQALVFCDVAGPDEAQMVGGTPRVSQAIGQITSAAIGMLKKPNGKVLLVGSPYGVTQDIVQSVFESAQALNLPLPQFIFVSRVAERTVQYGNIMGEWLCESKQALLYLPEYPFADKELRQKGHLHFVNSVNDLATLNVPYGPWFVVVEPNCTADIDYLVRQWRAESTLSESASVPSFSVLVHSDDPVHAQALVNRLREGAGHVTYIPIALRLTPDAVSQCLRHTAARHAILPSSTYARLFASATSTGRYEELEAFEYSYLDAVSVDLDADRHVPLNVQRELADRMVAAGKQHGLVAGDLTFDSGRLRLLNGNAGIQQESGRKPTPPHRPSGSPEGLDLDRWTAEALAEELCAVGLNAHVVQDGVKVDMPTGTVSLYLGSDWRVESSSPGVQWLVVDALKRVMQHA